MHSARVFALLSVLLFANAGVAAADLRAASGVVGGEFTYSVRKGDSLTSVGARFGV